MTDWNTGTPPRGDIYDVTLMMFRVPNKPFRMVALGAWDEKRRTWEIEPEMLSDGQVIAWAKRREPYQGDFVIRGNPPRV